VDTAAAPIRRSLHDLTFPVLLQEMSGLSPVHAQALWRALHRDADTDPHEREDFQAPLRRWLVETAARYFLDLPEVAADILSSDFLTQKFLLRLEDNRTIETVLMSFRGRYSACVSTQVGCAMGCVFCATGQMGFGRHLRAGEIVGQVLLVQRILRAQGEVGLRNLVLMGMGEPLHNYDSVLTALEILTDRRGVNLAPSHITISTVGVVPGILRLADEKQPYNLAVSLHGATEAERSALVPASKRWPLVDLIAACRTYCEKTGRRIFFEWTLIAGKNDSPAQAGRLAELLTGLDAHVNLIPLNPTDGYIGDATAAPAVKEFQRVLQAAGIPSTVRQRRGIDVAAGCGQLRAAKKTS
jgi:23S rRNA (adenine2503-C2)-methyltransferase